jgi:hypothetical protein
VNIASVTSNKIFGLPSEYINTIKELAFLSFKRSGNQRNEIITIAGGIEEESEGGTQTRTQISVATLQNFMKVMEGMSSPGKIPLADLKKSFEKFVKDASGEEVLPRVFGGLLGRLRQQHSPLLNKFEDPGTGKDKKPKDISPQKRKRSPSSSQSSHGNSSQDRKTKIRIKQITKRRKLKSNEDSKDKGKEVPDNKKDGVVNGGKNDDDDNHDDDSDSDGNGDGDGDNDDGGDGDDNDDENNNNEEFAEAFQTLNGTQSKTSNSNRKAGLSTKINKGRFKSKTNTKTKHSKSPSIEDFIPIDSNFDGDDIGYDNDYNYMEDVEDGDGENKEDDEDDQQEDGEEDDPYHVPEGQNFSNETTDEGNDEDYQNENTEGTGIKQLKLEDFVDPEKVKNLRNKSTMEKPRLPRHYQLAYTLLSRVYGDWHTFDPKRTRLDRMGKADLARTAESLPSFRPSAGAFPSLPIGKQLLPARRAREMFVLNLQRLLRIITRYTLEALAQSLAGNGPAIREASLHSLAGLYESMGLCQEERQWLVDPEMARTLKNHPLDKEGVFGDEEKKRIKKVNEEEKEKRELHRNAANANGKIYNTFRRGLPNRGGRSRGRGGGSFRGSDRGGSLPATAWTHNGLNDGTQGQARGGFFRGGGKNTNSSRGGANGNFRGNQTKGTAQGRGRGGRGGTW